MQKWYNSLTKGQRIVIAIIMFTVSSVIGILLLKDIALIIGLIGLLPSVFFELGRRKQAD